ncbi:hypothetical protein D3C84_1085580 [compost metagenome]
MPMATKPECDQIEEAPPVVRFHLPLRPGLALVRVQPNALERQLLVLAGKRLAHS